jgi:transposase InsO family protein
VFIRIFTAKTAANARRFLRDLERSCPIRIRTILIDNGKEFTDRLFGLRKRAATGAHEFDTLCAALDIEHRLTPPKSPQTNGMVERFNGRIEEVLQSHHFRSGEELETTLLRYVWLYNQQLPQSALGSKAPLQAMKDWHKLRPELFKKQPYYLRGCDSYLIVDIFSRKIVGWEVHDRETAEFAAQVLERAVWAEKCLTSPLVLHADNGSPMKATMAQLGVIASFSRPRVSNDNPFSEALFRTCKYTPNWPRRGFATIKAARAWVQSFAAWYNLEHRHSAIRFVTPDERHRDEDRVLLANRHQVYEPARAVRPERWSGPTRNWQPIGPVWLNPERPDSKREGHGSADALTQEAGGGGPMAGPAKRAA